MVGDGMDACAAVVEDDALHAVLCAAGFNIRWCCCAPSCVWAWRPFCRACDAWLLSSGRSGIAVQPQQTHHRPPRPSTRLHCALNWRNRIAGPTQY